MILRVKVCFHEAFALTLFDLSSSEDYATLRDQWVRYIFQHSVAMVHTYLCLFSHSFPPREGQGFVLVYSITSRSTFDRLEVFRQSMLRVKRQKPIFLLVGNKSDKTDEREVAKDEGIALARSFGCPFMETSAKTTHNVELLFANLVRVLRNTQQELETTLVASPQCQREEKKWLKICFIC